MQWRDDLKVAITIEVKQSDFGICCYAMDGQNTRVAGRWIGWIKLDRTGSGIDDPEFRSTTVVDPGDTNNLKIAIVVYVTDRHLTIGNDFL